MKSDGIRVVIFSVQAAVENLLLLLIELAAGGSENAGLTLKHF